MKGKKTIRVLLILLFLSLIAFAGAYAYVSLDTFRTPKQLFGKYLENQITQLKEINLGSLQTISDRLKSDTSETVLSIKNGSSDDESYTDLKLGFKMDPNDSKAELNINLSTYGLEDFANYTLYADKERVALNIPELNEKYFSLSIDNLLEGIEESLEDNEVTDQKIDLSKESIEKYKEEFKNLYIKYLEEVKSKLTDDKFTIEKNVNVLVNDSEITANRYSLALTYEEYFTIAYDILNEILNEPILSDFLTEEDIEQARDTVAVLKKSFNEEVEDKTKVIKFCIYESKGNTVKIEILNGDEVVAEFMLQKVSPFEKKIIFNTITEKTSELDVGKNVSMEYDAYIESDNTTTVTIKTTTSYNKDDIKALKKYYEENDYYYYTDEMVDEEYKNSTVTQKMVITLNGDKATNKITTSGLNSLGLNESKLQINYTFGSQVKFANLSDSIDLNDYKGNEEKQAELMAECMSNLQDNPNTLLGYLIMIFTGNGDSSMLENGINIFNNPSRDDNLSTIQDINDIEDDEDEDEDENEEVDEYALEKSEIEVLVRDALNDCLDSYKRDLEEDDSANVSDYLTVTKVSEMMLSSYVSNIEFADGSTIKCKYKGDVYYVKLIISAEDLEVTETIAYTESEYQEL